MATEYEIARSDMSKLLDGFVKKRLSKRDAMQIVDSILDKVWEIGYNDAVQDERIAREQNEW